MLTFGTLIFVAEIIILIAVLFQAYRSYKAGKVSETVVLNKTTEDGENLTIQLNFTKDMSQEDKAAKINSMFKLGEDRREYNDAQFKAKLEAERAKQDDQAKLKSV